jgi:hypothetical protein
MLLMAFLLILLFFGVGIYLLFKHDWDNGFFKDKFAFAGILCSITGAILCMTYFVYTATWLGLLFLSVLLLFAGLGVSFFNRYDRQKNFTNDMFGVLSVLYFSILFFLMLTPFVFYIFFLSYGFSLWYR